MPVGYPYGENRTTEPSSSLSRLSPKYRSSFSSSVYRPTRFCGLGASVNLVMASSSTTPAAFRYICMCCMETPRASPTLSNSCERPSSGSMSSNSSEVPKRSFIVFSYSRRLSLRSTVPLAAACDCTSRGLNAARNAVSSLASGRSFTLAGGISPAATRSKIRSHFANTAASERSRPSFSKSNPPLVAPSP